MVQEGYRGTGVWPNECKGAISLTFDDGLESQLAEAVPMLDDHGLRGTFYLVPRGDRWERNLSRWQEAGRRGHEMGNHSLGHTCSLGFRDRDDGAPALENMTIADIETDILAAEERLRGAFPEQSARSFCYPCYMDYVGAGPTRQSYVPVVAKHFIAARGQGEFANHPATCDLHYLWSWPAQRLSAWTLCGMAESCAAQGRWGIFTFHGIGEGHLPIAAHDLDAFLEYLERNEDRLWVAPVNQVAQRIIEWRRQPKLPL